jgi:hypothetical protein
MTKGGTKKMKIKAKKDTGEIVEVTDENNVPGVPVAEDEIRQIYESGGFRYVGVILHTHSSPGCYYIVSGGWAYKICW